MIPKSKDTLNKKKKKSETVCLSDAETLQKLVDKEKKKIEAEQEKMKRKRIVIGRGYKHNKRRLGRKRNVKKRGYCRREKENKKKETRDVIKFSSTRASTKCPNTSVTHQRLIRSQ